MHTSFKFLALTLLTVSFISCTSPAYQKTPGGMPYQLIRSKDTQQAQIGSYIKLSLTQKINDSVYFTTGDRLPIYIPVPPQTQPYDISELWTTLHRGDSVIATQMMDTFLKRLPAGNLPPEFKKGDRIITFIKVLGIFASDSLKTLDEQNENKAYSVRERSEVEKFLGGKVNSVQRTPAGAYVEVISAGAGDLIKKGDYVSVNYTGKTFEGKVFDSNTDTTFKHVEPLRFSVGVGQMIKGFDEAMPYLRKGGKGKIYIPSLLGYGAAPPPGGPIKPYDHLIFEVEITDVQAKAPETK